MVSTSGPFDYIIVGAGAAGCVLAHRLSEDPAVSVLLIEAGGSDQHPFIRMPKGLAKIMLDPARIWSYRAEPEAGNAFSTDEIWARGRVMGGSTSINGMVYVRGQPADFDDIAAQSSEDWSWRHIGAAYRALEAHALGADATRGATGPLRISMPERRDRLGDAIIAAGEQLGLACQQDINAPDGKACVGELPRTIWRGRRQSAVTAFITPIRDRRNLTILTKRLADRVIFDGDRAVEIEVRHDGRRERYRARQEIILCAGAMASPGILQRSGIGDPALLTRLGIPIVHAQPQVGRHLREHRGILLQWKLREPLSDNQQYSGWRLLRHVAEYFIRHRGRMAGAAYETGAWLCSDARTSRPDVQILFAPFSFVAGSNRTKLEAFPGMSVVAYPLRPTSGGEIDIRGRDPEVLPTLRPNYHSTAEDRALMLATVELVRRYVAQEPLRALIEAETWPGPQCADAASVLAAYDERGSCGYHAVGSCRMGRDADAVVDPQLRVRGVRGLRVMDTSVIPQMPSGNTNGPTMAMAWRAAELIIRDHH